MAVELESLSSLFDLIQRDSHDPSRYATRFILVHSVEDWKNLNGYFLENTEKGNRLYLSSMFTSSDGQPRALTILEMLDECLNGQFLLTPFSEALRFFGTEAYEAVVMKLAKLENGEANAHRRVYVPMLGTDAILKNTLSKLSGSDVEGQIAEVWSVSVRNNEVQSVYVFPASIQGVPGAWNSLMSLQEYFRTCEQSSCTNVGIATEHTKRILCNTDGSVAVNVFSCAYDMLAEYYEEILDLPKAAIDEDSWSQVLHIVLNASGEASSLVEKACAALRIGQISDQALFIKLRSISWVERCTLWIIMKLLGKRSFFTGYTCLVLNASATPNDLESLIEKTILTQLNCPENNRIALHKERTDLLRNTGIEELSDSFWQSWETLDPMKKLNALSFYTKKERANGIRLMFCELGYSLEDAYERADVQALYPALSAYISPFKMDEPDNWSESYFDEYRLCKLRNGLSKNLHEQISQWIRSKLYYKYEPRTDRLGSSSVGNQAVHFRDCIGAEWLPAISCLALEKDNSLEVKCSIVRATWPTITEENRPEDIAHCECFDDKSMDKLIHSAVDYPLYLVEELETIERIAARAAGTAKDSGVIITADHGASRMAILNKADIEEVPKGMDVKYFGRYIVGEWQDGEEWEIRHGYTIMKGYKRFSVSGTGGCEIHGGGTPEESLVPFIVLQKAVLKIKSYEKTIRIQAAKPILWKASLTKKVAGFSVRLQDGRVLNGTPESGLNGDQWVFDMGILQPGPTKLSPFATDAANSDGVFFNELTVDVVGGISERKLRI